MKFTFTDSVLVRSFFKDVLTGRDGESYDFGRVIGLPVALVYMVLGVFVAEYSPEHFTFVDFGGGFAAICTGLGVLLKLKENTEPPGASHGTPVP